MPRSLLALVSLGLGLGLACKAEQPQGQGGHGVADGAAAEESATAATDGDAWEAVNSAEAGPRVSLCEANSAALAEARAQLEAIEAIASGLTEDASVEAFNAKVAALYEHACLAVGRADEPQLELTMSSAIEAKTYWEDGLGSWFQSYLDLADGADSTVWFLPSRRVVVTAKTRPDDPLARWMCPADPESPCAQGVRAWRSRAERYFDLWDNSGRREHADCDAAIAAGPAEDAYARWRACEGGALRRHSVLPIGGLGRLAEGWVVVLGRRGHYRYCDEVAAFDLVSGSYYRFAECDHRPELDGMVEAGAMDPASGKVEVETGTIEPGLVQEFAWAAASAAYVQPEVVTERALGTALPDGLKVSRTQDGTSSGMGISGMGSSSHTRIGWLWARAAGEIPAHGELSWPTGLSNAEMDHAVRLLAIAEERGAKGCASVKLPTWVGDSLVKGRLPESELVDPPSAAVLKAVRAASAQRCAK
ncbi:MAG: hypothetical protein R3A79_08195 [Nannocystaceae bacterium]